MKQKNNQSTRRPGKSKIRPLGGEMSVSGALSEAQIATAADQGYRTIIDLRGAGEPIAGIAPDHERRTAEGFGMAYEHIPMGGNPLDGSRVNDLRVALWAAEPKILMHCGSGTLAALCAMIHLGCQSGWTIDQCLDFAREHGIDFSAVPTIKAYLEQYLQRNSRAYLETVSSSQPGSRTSV